MQRMTYVPVVSIYNKQWQPPKSSIRQKDDYSLRSEGVAKASETHKKGITCSQQYMTQQNLPLTFFSDEIQIMTKTRARFRRLLKKCSEYSTSTVLVLCRKLVVVLENTCWQTGDISSRFSTPSSQLDRENLSFVLVPVLVALKYSLP
jgi:hypothetical protein